MKIIRKDNFDRETVSEKVVAENVPDYYAPIITQLLNEKLSGEHSDDFFTAQPDNYVPYTFEP